MTGGRGPAPCRFEGNSADVAFRAALAGLGIARLPLYMVADALRTGALVRVLADRPQVDVEVSVLFPERRNLAPKVRAFVDFLADGFGEIPRGGVGRRTERPVRNGSVNNDPVTT